MQSKRHSAVPAVYIIMKNDGRVLLMLRQNTGYFDDWYALPSGHLEENELPFAAMAREAKEEVGVDLIQEKTSFVHAMYRTACDATGDRCDYFFVTDEWHGEPSNMEEHKCLKLEWFSVDALPENLMPHVRKGIEAIHRNESFSELGANELVTSP